MGPRRDIATTVRAARDLVRVQSHRFECGGPARERELLGPRIEARTRAPRRFDSPRYLAATTGDRSLEQGDLRVVPRKVDPLARHGGTQHALAP
ncbi:MAG: hypothetical protein CVT69_02085 [Actinobacteria bacterium HGW-Actinobacteria-9]|nr:MAG: hypothetical protein CVT69_02085 [Actinobacteria bacterium HGW-Actinobacteria-9]